MKNPESEKDELVHVQFKGDVTEDLVFDEDRKTWGFSISRDERTAFVEIGSRKVFEQFIDRFDESPLSVVIYAIQQGEDELASVLLDEIRDEEMGLIFNGEFVSNEDFLDALGVLGEKECERVQSYRNRFI